MNHLDVAHFKEVLGHYATGLVIVTGATSEGPAGFTCQSFGSLSLEPPLVIFAAGSGGQSWSRVRGVEVVGISILAQDQETTARRFATSGVDKFESIVWERGPLGSPLLEGALAHLEGRVAGVTTHGDHDVVVVAVTHIWARPGRPLVYFRGGFGELA